MMGQGVFTVGILMLVDSTVSLCLGAASQRPATRRSGSEESCPPLHIFLVLLVNDSEYSDFTGQKPI